MKTVIYHNPRCTKSREALALLNELHEEVEVVEYLKNTPSEEELRSLIKKLKIKPELLMRKKEPVFKEKFEGKKLTDDECIKAMVENPVLIERPIIVKNNKAIIGRPPQNIHDIL